ncbi:MAG: OsmC family protein [Alphaproteobacteria bacterium]|jgi:organic hydroperoxide reductase OsmC/OhrA
MAEHRAGLRWRRTMEDFQYQTYNRGHEVLFKDGAIVLPASSAPAFQGDAERVDPEEAYVASLSSCHMLTFLAICARKRLTVDSYEDDAAGVLEKGPNGRLWLATVRLRPLVRFAPSVEVALGTLKELHHQSHEECFIANSVKTTVTIEPRL